MEGETLQLTCLVDGKPAAFQYEWMKDGVLLQQSITESLVINNLKGSHSGYYSCTAKNSAGSSSNGTRVSVYGKLLLHLNYYDLQSSMHFCLIYCSDQQGCDSSKIS